MKVAFICLGAYHIGNYTKEQNFHRQSLYSIALHQALNIAKNEETIKKNINCHFYIVENTVSDEGQIIDELKVQFSDPLIQDVQFINNNSLGAKNKGAGEYLMCRAVIDKHKEALKNYDWIVYYTLRQIIVAPVIHETIASIGDENVIVGNPDYFNSDGSFVKAAPGNYCDMIFAMKPEQFFRYIDSMSPDELAAKKMSSETNLYNFIAEGKKSGSVKAREKEPLGVMRYDYAINKTQIV